MFMHMLAAAFSEQRWTIDRVIVEGEYVALHCIAQRLGTLAKFFGVPATGRRFAYKQMHMIRMVDGRGAEHWAVRTTRARGQLTGAAAGRARRWPRPVPPRSGVRAGAVA
ncbi:ester cyclase [Pseudonocardia sp. MCCB 268]|nr:ester cyclase [Pseudonocardia cytotoxica]